MASPGLVLPAAQFHCSICRQVFTDPVTTPCGHNFCRACIRAAWGDAEACRCPACEKPFAAQPEMSVNAAFKDLAEAFKALNAAPVPAEHGEVACDVCAAASLRVKAVKSCLACVTSYCGAHLEPHGAVAALRMHKLIEPAAELQGRLCPKHGRPLEMFCKDDRTCICTFCTETEHKDHRTVKIEEESEERKVHMTEWVEDFQRKILQRQAKAEEIRSGVRLCVLSAEKEQTEIDRLFASLMDSAKERQELVGAELKERRDAAERRAERLVGELQREISELRRRSGELEELRKTDDHLHLLQVDAAIRSSKEWAEITFHSDLGVGAARRALSGLSEVVGAELERLRTDEMKRMQKHAVDVTLDPDSAHPNIVLSADGKRAGRGEPSRLVPDLPQRFDPVICVTGRRGFLSGRFYFQVAVGDKTFWDVGVVRESVTRKGMITSKPENGFWTVRLRGGDEYRALDSPSVLLRLEEKPRTVGVFVDLEEATVSFFDVEARCHLYTFTGCSFEERLFPFFSPGVLDEGKNAAPLVITAVNGET